jgi:hypothetical protein
MLSLSTHLLHRSLLVQFLFPALSRLLFSEIRYLPWTAPG